MFRDRINLINKVMRNSIKLLVIVIASVCLSFKGYCFSEKDTLVIQKDTSEIAQRIEQLAKQVEALNKTIDITVSNVSIQEFVRSVANLSGLNINVSPELNFIVVNNFTKVRVADLLIFLCKQYDIKVSIVGNIVDLYKTTIIPKPLKGVVDYDKSQDLLSLDFQNIPLSLVTRQIVTETNKNIFAEPDIQNKTVNIYLQRLPFKNAIENLTKSNNLDFEENDDGSYFIKGFPEKQQNVENNRQQYNSSSSRRMSGNQTGGYDLNITKTGPKTFTINAVDAPIVDVIRETSKQCGINYYLSGKIEGTTTMTLSNVEFEDFLKGLLVGRDFGYLKDGNTYIIGEKKLDKFKTSRIIKFENRPVDSLIVRLPSEIKKDLELKEFSDLNSIIATGSQERIKMFEDFCKQIDKMVPVIMIEVIIVDVSNNKIIQTGISAGLDNSKVPTKSNGSIFPGLDINLSTKGINSLISKINGTGVANLGNVSNDFYLSLKALETMDLLKVRSTPILSTLNGNEAKISIGETKVYKTGTSNVSASQTSVVSNAWNYQDKEAKLEVIIKPFVSGDDQITLSVKFTKSSFKQELIENTAYPGQYKKEFSSKIRVKNHDMILLGGLEENSLSESSSGVPFLQRIPIIKWFFSSRSKNNSDTKLNIFIRPTIIG